MSFARISRPIEVCIEQVGLQGGLRTLQLGIEIKNITLTEGVYFFEAHIFRSWHRCSTDKDLPAFTDKGSKRREARMRDALVHGRPRLGPHTQNAGFKVTDAQLEWLRARSSESQVSISAFIRATMISIGMPE